MFSTFGPDTLKELRAAFSGVDQHTHVSRFIDLHDIGDILVQRGFADPVMFSTFGPDTLKELRAAFSGVDQHTHVSRFIDLHDIGDILVQRGFADPVMDMEPFTLTYSNVRAVMRDLKAIGAHNVTQSRPPGLTGKSRLRAVEQAYEPLRREGKLPATFEVVYGHAWKPLPRLTASGKRVIDIKPAT